MMPLTFTSIRPGMPSVEPLLRVPATAWLSVAILCYVLSAQAFGIRDPLSTAMCWHIYLQLALFFSAFAVAGVCWLRRGILAPPPGSFWFFLLCGGLGLASATQSFWPPLSAMKALLFCCVILLVEFLSSSWRPESVLRSMYWSLVVVYLFGLILGAVLPDVYPLTVSEEFTGRVRLALFTFTFGDFAYLTGAGFLIGRLPCVRAPWYAQAFLLALTIASGSKTCTAGLLLVWGFAQIKHLRKPVVLVSALTAAALGIAGLQVVLNSDSLVAQKLLVSLQRLYGSQLLQESRSLNGRTELWEIVSIAWERCLLFGFGFDGARDQILRLIPWAGQSHNGFLEFFLSTGMPGLVAFLAGWISAVRTGLSSPFGRAAVPVYCYLLIVANAGPIFTMFQCYGLFMILALHYWVRQPAPERLAIVQQTPGYSLGSALMRAS
jgi:hypothetical protein